MEHLLCPCTETSRSHAAPSFFPPCHLRSSPWSREMGVLSLMIQTTTLQLGDVTGHVAALGNGALGSSRRPACLCTGLRAPMNHGDGGGARQPGAADAAGLTPCIHHQRPGDAMRWSLHPTLPGAGVGGSTLYLPPLSGSCRTNQVYPSNSYILRAHVPVPCSALQALQKTYSGSVLLWGLQSSRDWRTRKGRFWKGFKNSFSML